MTSKSRNQPLQQNALALKQNIPIMLTDMTTFDSGYALLKERFKREMLRIDEQINKLSSDLMTSYGETSTVKDANTGKTSTVQTANICKTSPHYGNSTGETTTPYWEVLNTSPLVVGEGNDKCLQLQFDVSQFDAAEINVKILNDVLIVTASHEEKTPDTTVYREYNRQFNLPPGMDPELVMSTLSRDGVLTVVAPLPLSMPPSHASHTTSSYFSEG